jgi:hypothetical protein
MSHATGRKISRSESKKEMFFLGGFPKNVYIPYFISAENLNEELPENYKTIEETLKKIEPYAKVVGKLTPKSSVML